MREMWVQADSGKNGGQYLIDVDTRKSPTLFEGNGVTVNLGCFQFDKPKDLSSFARLNLVIREVNDLGNEPLVDLDLLDADDEFNHTLSTSAWNTKSAYHAQFVVPQADLVYAMGGELTVPLWMVFTGYDAEGLPTNLGAVEITLDDDLNNPAGAPYRFLLKDTYFVRTALTYAVTITPDCDTGLSRSVVMTGDMAVNAPTNGVDGMVWKLKAVASGGSRELTFHADIVIPDGFLYEATVASGSTAIIHLEFTGTEWVLVKALTFAT